MGISVYAVFDQFYGKKLINVIKHCSLFIEKDSKLRRFQ